MLFDAMVEGMGERMKEYTQEMRVNKEPCPYCGFWHSAMSHPPQFNGYILEIQRLEEQNQRFTEWHAEQGKTITELREKKEITRGSDSSGKY